MNKLDVADGRAIKKKMSDIDTHYVYKATFQCLKCEVTHEKPYNPPIWWNKFDEERVNGLFKCPACNVRCEAIGHFVEKEQPEIQAEQLEATVIPKVTEEEIESAIQTIKKEAKYDEPSIKQLYYGMNTAFTKLGMGHKVNSRDSGAGKSYLTNKVAGYFPKRYVLILGGASNKAFQHKRGELVVKDEDGNIIPLQDELDRLEERADEIDDKKSQEYKEIQKTIKSLKGKSQKLINLNNTIIVIQDTPQEGLFSSIMSLVSQDSEDDRQEYMFVDDKIQGTSNILQGMPSIYYTRTLDDTRNSRAEEVFRRFVNVSPTVSKNKTHEANRITFKRHGLLPEEYDEQVVSRTAKQEAKDIIENVVEHLIAHTRHLGPKESGVKILFEETLSHTMPDDNVFQMTVSDRLARYLDIITKVRMCSRPRLVHKITGAFYPISTFKDLKEAFILMQTGGSNIRPYLVAMYNEVIFPLWSKILEPRHEMGKDRDGNDIVIAKENYIGLRVKEIIDGAKDLLNLKISSKDMYSKYLTPMVEQGLLNWVKSVLKGNEKIYYPSDPESSKVNTLFPEGDLKLTVNDVSFYPSKENLEQSYGFRSKLSSEQGGKKNISDIYTLQDHEGNEITISELIETYLSNPELCFNKGWSELKSTNNFGGASVRQD